MKMALDLTVLAGSERKWHSTDQKIEVPVLALANDSASEQARVKIANFLALVCKNSD
jgi:hypothetical protein